jgi:uncharacterized protein (TIGR02466 family)
MTQPAPDRPQIQPLWPTLFLSHRLPGYEQANPALLDLIQRMERARPDLTTDYLEGNFFAETHPVIDWLEACIRRCVTDYAGATGIDYELDFHVQGWANVNRFGDYHNLHNHPYSWLSGTYYVQVPDTNRELQGRSDLNPGAISFFDPRPQANMNAIKRDAQVNPEHRVQPRPGDILLWPAFVHHLVHPNLSDQMRVSISFNVVLRWHDRYMP